MFVLEFVIALRAADTIVIVRILYDNDDDSKSYKYINIDELLNNSSLSTSHRCVLINIRIEFVITMRNTQITYDLDTRTLPTTSRLIFIHQLECTAGTCNFPVIK